MRIELEPALQRWTSAGLLEIAQAAEIRRYEADQAPEHRSRLPVLIGLAFGGLMAAAGMLLFVSAHWDSLSPVERMATLIAAVGGLHLAGALMAERSPATSATLHAIGTVALGGAVFLAGQIFNLEEHWPTGLMLWAAGALAGYALLRQWPQLALSAILVPAWLLAEMNGDSGYGFSAATIAAALLAICYLSVRRESGPQVYAWIGGISLIPAVLTVALGRWWGGSHEPTAFEMLLAVLPPLVFALWYRKGGAWANGVAAVWVLGLYAAARFHMHAGSYAWCAVGCAGLILWGVYEQRSERVNLGMASFALTVAAFFFSDVMDKLGRSVSLLVLGALFLGGGWYWEKVRRQLVAQTRMGGIQ
jgi:uncharacterized membrane protein